MKKIIILLFFVCLILGGCTKDENKFSLDEKYYENNEYINLDKDSLDTLIENKESFAVFIYQPLCTASYEFNKVLTEFSNIYQVSFYKIAFSDIKDTPISNYVKYYPSLIIYNKGKVVDYLDADNDKHTEYYKSVEDFAKWFSKYVNIEKTTNTSNNELEEEKIDEQIKIDANLENVIYDENKVNIYFFWGDGCPHCEKEFKFLESIKTEYGDYFILNTFEVWHNEDNQQILNQFASNMKDEITGVPYTIIGNKSFKGFNEKYEKKFLEAIKTQYKNSYDVYFKNKN